MIPPFPPKDGWGFLGGSFVPAGAPAVCSWSPDRLDIVAIGTDNGAWHKCWDGSLGDWSPKGDGWQSLGGSFRSGSDLAMTSWGAGRFDIVGIGHDGRCWHKAWDFATGWSPPGKDWTPLGGDFSTTDRLALTSWGTGRLDIVGVGQDGRCWHKAWDNVNGWSPAGEDWHALGGNFLAAPGIAATAWGPGRLDLVGISTDRQAWHKSWQGDLGWSPPDEGWQRLGGSFKAGTTLATCSWAPGRLDIVGIGADGTALTKCWDDSVGWQPAGEEWARIGGSWSNSPGIAAVSDSPGLLHLVGATGGAVWSKSWNYVTGWSPEGEGWSRLGGQFPAGAGPAAVSWAPGRIDLFATSDAMWHRADLAPAAPRLTIGSEFRLPINAQETTCAAFPARGAEAAVLIVSGSGGDWGGSLRRAPLNVPVSSSAPVVPLTNQLASAPPMPAYPENNFFPGTDNQTIRIGGDTVLNLKGGGTTQTIHPRPSWWDTVTVNGRTAGYYRISALFYRSTNRGITWQRDPISSVDSARVAFPLNTIGAGQGVEVGRSAWPQILTGETRVPGGWDRPDAYFCFWTRRLYLHVNSDSGNSLDGHLTSRSLLFVSEDGGVSWDTDQSGNLVPRHTFDRRFFVVAMTSRHGGCFYLYSTRADGTPELFLSTDGGRNFASRPVFFTDEQGAQRLNVGVGDLSLVGLKTDLLQSWTHAISRTRTGVRLAYCGLHAGAKKQQSYNVIHVRWDDPAADPLVTSVCEIVAQKKAGHVLYATFVETDRVELDSANLSDAALLYWVETDGSKIHIQGMITHGEVGWTESFRLSDHSWEPTNSFAIGDYMKGAFYYDDTLLNYVAFWPEVTAAGAECCYRLVSVVPDAS